MKNYIALFAVCIENLKDLNYHTLVLKKTLVLSIICSKCKNKEEKIFKDKKSVEISKVLGLIQNI